MGTAPADETFRNRPVTVRLPEASLNRVHTISQASVRPMASLAVFALAHFLDLADTDPDRFVALSIEHLPPGSGDAKFRLSAADRTQVFLARRLAATYREKFNTAPAIDGRLYRAALMSWLDAHTDEELLAQVGSPTIPQGVLTA